MRSKLEVRFQVFNLIVGLFAINVAFLISYILSFNDTFAIRDVNTDANYRILLAVANLLYIVIGLRPSAYVRREFRSYSLFLIGYLALMVFLKAYEFSRVFHLYFLGLLFVFTMLWRYGNAVDLVKKYILPTSFITKVLLVGEQFDASIIEFISSRPGDYKCVGILSEAPLSAEMERIVDLHSLKRGNIEEIEELLSSSAVDEVLISTSVLSTKKLSMIMRVTEKYHTLTCMLPPYFQFLMKQNCESESWMGVPIISIVHSDLAISYYRAAKRIFDILFSLLFLVVVFPIIFLLVTPAIWLSGRGPIFFKQLRKGYKQEPFYCYKFRTMKNGNGKDETVQAKVADPRVTAVGRTLRKTSIDEAPQFLNVLWGNMSVVGPRPHMVEHDETYDKFIERYNVRFVTKPGITGWAQVNGFRGATEDDSLMERRIEHDLWYIKNWSLGLDIKIVFMTVWSLIKGDKNAV